MRSRDIFWGVILLGIGVIFLFRNLEWISFDWIVLRSLWPVLLIILGISLLPLKGYIRLLLSFIVIIVSLVYLSLNPVEEEGFFKFPKKFHWKWEESNEESENYKEWSDTTLQEAIGTEVERAILDIDAIAGNYSTETTQDDLFKIEVQEDKLKFRMKTERAGNSVIIRVKPVERSFSRSIENASSTIYLPLHPVWDINMDAGAAKVDFDLSEIKLDRMEIDGGAADIRVKVGELYPETQIRINAGAASVKIEVPEKSGCEIKTSTILVSKDFEGFRDLGEGLYRTPNYSTARNKISVKIDAAVSNLRVVRY